jgi:hypothetical protein
MQHVRVWINELEHRAAEHDPGHQFTEHGRLADALC